MFICSLWIWHIICIRSYSCDIANVEDILVRLRFRACRLWKSDCRLSSFHSSFHGTLYIAENRRNITGGQRIVALSTCYELFAADPGILWWHPSFMINHTYPLAFSFRVLRESVELNTRSFLICISTANCTAVFNYGSCSSITLILSTQNGWHPLHTLSLGHALWITSICSDVN